MRKCLVGLFFGVVIYATSGCTTVRHVVEVKPIEVTVNVNIKVMEEIDDFFDFTKKTSSKPKNEKKGDE